MPLHDKEKCATPREVEEIAKKMLSAYENVAQYTEADHSEQGELLRILDQFLIRNGM